MGNTNVSCGETLHIPTNRKTRNKVSKTFVVDIPQLNSVRSELIGCVVNNLRLTLIKRLHGDACFGITGSVINMNLYWFTLPEAECAVKTHVKIVAIEIFFHG
jgi:hypothetical protein